MYTIFYTVFNQNRIFNFPCIGRLCLKNILHDSRDQFDIFFKTLLTFSVDFFIYYTRYLFRQVSMVNIALKENIIISKKHAEFKFEFYLTYT